MSVLHRRQLHQLSARGSTRSQAPSPIPRLMLSGRLGRAGYITEGLRRKLLLRTATFAVVMFVSALFLGRRMEYPIVVPLVTIYFGIYLGAVLLRNRGARLEASLLYEIPLLLESLILLIEAGLSLGAALERLCDTDSGSIGKRYITYLLMHAKRESASGIVYSEALRTIATSVPFAVVQHVLFYLDLGSREGGSSARSLRALADYSHSEWQIAVTARVRRLETLIVFPVFTAVMGLLMLVGGGTIVTLYEREAPMFIPPEVSTHAP